MGVLNVWNGSQWVPINVLGDHGTLSGLLDDDHTQYILVNGSRAFTSPVGGVTPTGSNQLATKGYVDSAIGGPYVSLSSFTGHTGDSSIHFTQASISITSSQVSNFNTSVNSLISPLSGAFTGHTGQTSIHFTQGEISIPSTQISDFTEATQDVIGALLQDSSTVNFTYNDGAGTLQTDVIVTGIDHNNLLNYSATRHIDHSSVIISGFSGLTGGGNLTSSTGIWLTNTSVTPGTYGSSSQVSVFTVDQQGRITNASNSSISVPASAVSDFSEAVDDRVGVLIVGQSGITVVYNDSTNLLYVGLSGVLYTDVTSHLVNTSNPHNVTTTQIGAATLLAFTGYTGEVGDLARYVFRDGSRGFTGVISGITPTNASHLATKGYVDSIISSAPVLDNFIQISTSAGQSGVYTLSGGVGITLHTGISGYVVINNTGMGLAIDYREFTGDIIPNSSGSYNIGSITRTVSSIYADNIDVKNDVEANTFKLANSQWIQARNSGDTSWVNIIRVNSSDEVEINSSVFSGISFSELMFEAGAVPDTPITDAFKIFAYTTGISPNKEVTLYTLDKNGTQSILTSLIE